MIQLEDLIIGKVYYCESGRSDKWTFKYDGDLAHCFNIAGGTSFYRAGNFSGAKFITPASESDTLWLESCIIADRFLPKQELI